MTNLTEEIPQTDEIPEILLQESKERFRRRLLIASRLLAVCLIIVIFYFGYVNYKYGEFVKSFDGNPCFSCGYRFGMKCNYVYDYLHLNSSQKEAFLLDLGYQNVNQSNVKYEGGLPHYNFTEINFSKDNSRE